MPAVIPILLGTAAVGGALSNRPKTTTSNTTSSWNNTSTQNPVLDPIQQRIYELLTSRSINRLNQPTPLGGYESTGLSNINKVSDAVRRNLENRLASNGISGPAAGSSMTQLELARAGEATRFQNSLPLLAREMGFQDEAAAAAAYGLKPLGTTTTSTGTGTNMGSTTTPGNMAGGALSSVGSILGYLAGMGKLGTGSGPTAPTGVPVVPQTANGQNQSPITPDLWKIIFGGPNYTGGSV